MADAAVWTLIGLLATALFAILVEVRGLGTRIDEFESSLNARMMGSRPALALGLTRLLDEVDAPR